MRKSQQEIAAPKPAIKKNSGAALATKRITYIATLTAITVILKTLGNILTVTPSLRISLTYSGWIISAIILGPLGGAAVGFTSDIIGYFLASAGGPINPALIAGNTLFPIIVALCYKYLPFNKNLNTGIGVIISTLVCTLGINSLGLYFMFGYNESISFFTYIITMRYMQPIIIAVNLILCLSLTTLTDLLKLNLEINKFLKE